MTPTQEIRHWQSKFRILKHWKIRYDRRSEYQGWCHFCERKKIAITTPLKSWRGRPGTPDDYFLHEVLHIAMREVGLHRKHRVRRENEEWLVQDLCKLIFRKGST
jgi:hypothetical protein